MVVDFNFGDREVQQPNRGPARTPRYPKRLSPNIGRFSLLGFLSFAGAFAGAAWLIEGTSSTPKTSTVASVTDWDRAESLGQDPNPEITPGGPNSPSDPGGPRNPDYFNRRERMRTPWVLHRAVAVTNAQAQAAQRQIAQQDRVQSVEDRKRAAAARQNDQYRRQNEIDRFTESRRLATHRLGDETPRGRSAERYSNTAASRQRSISTASSYSASSDDSW